MNTNDTNRTKDAADTADTAESVHFAGPSYADLHIPGYPPNTKPSTAIHNPAAVGGEFESFANGNRPVDLDSVGGTSETTILDGPIGTEFTDAPPYTADGQQTEGPRRRRTSISMIVLGLIVLAAGIVGVVPVSPGNDAKTATLVVLAPFVLVLSVVVLFRLRRP